MSLNNPSPRSGRPYAVGFYERHGYQCVDTATVEKRGVPVTVVEMERRL